MFARNLLITIFLIVFAGATAFADGGFFGSIDYRNCDCSNGPGFDQVKISSTAGGSSTFWSAACGGGGPDGYNTGTQTFPPGWYDIAVVLGISTDCDKVQLERVYHGTDDQRVNLIVYGPTPKPDAPGGD